MASIGPSSYGFRKRKGGGTGINRFINSDFAERRSYDVLWNLPRGDRCGCRGLFYCLELALMAGEKDLAIQQLEFSAQNAIGIDYGDLKLNPMWDPVRGDPRFEKIVNSLAPKDN
jgi:hypothetical protein